MEVVTAAQRLSIIDLELYKGAAARVRGWTEITEIIGFPCTGGSKGASPDRRRFKFQLGGPSLHIIRPRSERYSSLISLRLAGFPCALSTATAHRSKSAGRYMHVCHRLRPNHILLTELPAGWASHFPFRLSRPPSLALASRRLDKRKRHSLPRGDDSGTNQ